MSIQGWLISLKIDMYVCVCVCKPIYKIYDMYMSYIWDIYINTHQEVVGRYIFIDRSIVNWIERQKHNQK